jgi:hypothetical protein
MTNNSCHGETSVSASLVYLSDSYNIEKGVITANQVDYLIGFGDTGGYVLTLTSCYLDDLTINRTGTNHTLTMTMCETFSGHLVTCSISTLAPEPEPSLYTSPPQAKGGGIIVGLVVGPVAGVLVIAAIVIALLLRRRPSSASPDTSVPPAPEQSEAFAAEGGTAGEFENPIEDGEMATLEIGFDGLDTMEGVLERRASRLRAHQTQCP